MPWRSTGARVFFSFSNGPRKFVSIVDGVTTFPEIFFKIGTSGFTDTKSTITRPITNLGKDEKRLDKRPSIYRDI